MKQILILLLTGILFTSCKKEKTSIPSKLIWDPNLEVLIDINKQAPNRIYVTKDPDDTSKIISTIDLKAGDEIKIYNIDKSNINVIELNEGRLVQQIDTFEIKSFISGETKVYKIKKQWRLIIEQKINWDSLKIIFPTIKKFK